MEQPETKTALDWEIIRSLFPYLRAYKGRAAVAVLLLIAAKGATVAVPLVLRDIVDTLAIPSLDRSNAILVQAPIALLLAYGALRFASSAFNELQSVVFTRVRHGIMRQLSLQLLEHLHALSLRFHLDRKTGQLTRDMDRGTSSIATLLNYLLFRIVPTFVEVGLVATILVSEYDWRFALITVITMFFYVGFTLSVTQWRLSFRREMHKLDSAANGRAVDSLLNYETVKYFGNERFEIDAYNQNLTDWENLSIKVQRSLSVLNAGQALLITAGVTVAMILAAQGVAEGRMTIGDLVAVNAFLLQLFVPLGFLGTIYNIIKNSITDMDRMFGLLDLEPEVQDVEGAPALDASDSTVRFEHIDFSYDPDRQVLFDVDFEIPAGQRVAVVGASGSGKSTLVRLLYRFYDVQGGAVSIGGQDIRSVQQSTVRQAIGIVPQDTVLFNDTIEYNLRYGRLDATREEIEEAATMAHIHTFIESLPAGYDTVVGERGLKLSGGEKQRVAIARAILKNPQILLFDEATSSLDSESEQAILEAMEKVGRNRTTLTIAHRLSTVVDSDTIIVMSHGRIIERGTHDALLEANGAYAGLWKLQQRDSSQEGSEAVPE